MPHICDRMIRLGFLQFLLQPLYEVAYFKVWTIEELPFRKLISNPQNIKRKFDVVYLNFTGLHLLHL